MASPPSSAQKADKVGVILDEEEKEEDIHGLLPLPLLNNETPHHRENEIQAPPLPHASPRATRSCFPLQNGETAVDNAKESDGATFGDKHLKATWKDEWVMSLIRFRGSINDDLSKPQKSGADIWSRVSAQMTEAHQDFDKNGESCRKKWQRIYKSFKDSKALLANPGAAADKQCTCKWFDLVEHYMQNQMDNTENEQDEVVGTISNSKQSRTRSTGKCPRRDEEIKESLSAMVETWRESLEVLRYSEAKRLATLQRLSGTMTGLLDILRK